MAPGTDPQPVAGVFWDLENCQLPSSTNTLPQAVASNVRDFAIAHGRIACFKAYADCSLIGQNTRLGLQQSGVSLLDIPNHAKDAADKAMIVDMCLFAVENKVPATIILISGDRDFANALQRLRQLGYRVVVASIYNRGEVPHSLRFAAEDRVVHDWRVLATHGASACSATQPAPSESTTIEVMQQTKYSAPNPPPLTLIPLHTPAQHAAKPSHMAESETDRNGVALKKSMTVAIANLPTNLRTDYLTRLPSPCYKAVQKYFSASPKPAPVQHPYAELVALINQYCPAKLTYKEFGYTKLLFLLRDAQAAGILHLRPGSKKDPKGQPYAEIVPSDRAAITNPHDLKYWLALGFTYADAQVYRQKATAKQWTDPIVGTLTSSSPHFDAKLHSLWYFATAGEQSWSVRCAMRYQLQKQKAGQPGGAAAAGAEQQKVPAAAAGGHADAATYQCASIKVTGDSPLSQDGVEAPASQPLQASDGCNSNDVKRLPQNCRAAIIQFWAAHSSSSVKSPFTELERHIQTSCGGYAALGYGSLPEFLRAAQTAGLLWLRGGVPSGNGAAEAVTVSKSDLANPSHAMYWLTLGFTAAQARYYSRKVFARDWKDEVVGKLARNSPHFDPELHARLQSGDTLPVPDEKATGTVTSEPGPLAAGVVPVTADEQPNGPPKTDGPVSVDSGDVNSEVAAEAASASDPPTTDVATDSVASGAVEAHFPIRTPPPVARGQDDSISSHELGLEQILYMPTAPPPAWQHNQMPPAGGHPPAAAAPVDAVAAGKTSRAPHNVQEKPVISLNASSAGGHPTGQPHARPGMSADPEQHHNDKNEQCTIC